MNPDNGEWYKEKGDSSTSPALREYVITKLRERDRVYALIPGPATTATALTRIDVSFWQERLASEVVPEELWAGVLPVSTIEWRRYPTFFDVNSIGGYAAILDLIGFDATFGTPIFVNVLVKCDHKALGAPESNWSVDTYAFAGGTVSSIAVSESHLFTSLSSGLLRRQPFGNAIGSSFSLPTGRLVYHDGTDRLWFSTFDVETSTWSIRYIDSPGTAAWNIGSVTTWREWVDLDPVGAVPPLDGILQSGVNAVHYSDETNEVLWLLATSVDGLGFTYVAKAPFDDSGEVELVKRRGETVGGLPSGSWDLGFGLRWPK